MKCPICNNRMEYIGIDTIYDGVKTADKRLYECLNCRIQEHGSPIKRQEIKNA